VAARGVAEGFRAIHFFLDQGITIERVLAGQRILLRLKAVRPSPRSEHRPQEDAPLWGPLYDHHRPHTGAGGKSPIERLRVHDPL
jgi:hypothetical protein